MSADRGYQTKRHRGGDPTRRFEQKVEYEPNSGCWLWNASVNEHGYGEFYLADRIMKAHRASWLLHVGAIPTDLGVLHKCDTPPCVNPAHLFLGTQVDNARDCARKGRKVSHTGETHPRAKLTAADVECIRQDPRGCSEIGREYGVSDSAIWMLRNGRNWRGA